jgi:hypothetical protein
MTFTPTTIASAQEETPKKIEVLHKAPAATTLPAAASTMQLTIELRNTRSIDHKIRLVGARDGKLLDIVFPSGSLSAADVPTYQLGIPAPIAAMSYQFIVHQPDGTLTTTKQFNLQRSCIQNFKTETAETKDNPPSKRELAGLVARSRTLEQETTNLETAYKLIEEIKATLP